MKVRTKGDGFRSVTFETERGARIIYDFRWDSVTVIPAILVDGGAFTVPAEEFVAAVEESRRLRPEAPE